MGILFDPLDGLTPRQLQIVRLAYEGKGEAAICQKLGIAVRTLHRHITSIRHVLPCFRLPKSALLRLTRRQREIACLVAEGLTNDAIRRRLGICEGTLEIHLAHLYRKTKSTNRVQLARTILLVQNRILIGATEAA